MKTKNITAFPLKHADDKFNPGMTLRDYFAGQVILGIVSNKELLEGLQISLRESTRLAYELADALLIERQKYEPKDNR
jgi:hypothetical protein